MKTKKLNKKILAVLMSMMMCMSGFQITAFADTSADVSDSGAASEMSTEQSSQTAADNSSADTDSGSETGGADISGGAGSESGAANISASDTGTVSNDTAAGNTQTTVSSQNSFVSSGNDIVIVDGNVTINNNTPESNDESSEEGADSEVEGGSQEVDNNLGSGSGTDEESSNTDADSSASPEDGTDSEVKGDGANNDADTEDGEDSEAKGADADSNTGSEDGTNNESSISAEEAQANVAAAKAEAEQAEAAQTTAKGEADSAAADVTAAGADVDKISAELTAAEEAVSNAASEEEAAQAAAKLEEVKAALSQAEAKLADAKTKAESADAALTAAIEAFEKAQAKLAKAEEDAKNAANQGTGNSIGGGGGAGGGIADSDKEQGDAADKDAEKPEEERSDCEHEYANGVCIKCEAECPHEEYIDGKCVVCGMNEPETISETVQAFLNAVKALPEEVTAANFEEVFALMGACQDAYDALSSEDLEREDVNNAIIKMAALMEAASTMEETGNSKEVDSFDALENAVKEAGETPTTINIVESFNLTGYLQINAGQNITLTANEGVVLGRPNTNPALWVKGTLTLENIVFDGKNIPAKYALLHILATGDVTMGEGAVIQNAYNDYTGKQFGGGVYNAGTFTLNGGSITGNTAKSYGGGVYNAGTFIMNGGTISGNTNPTWYGGGVYNAGTFTMTNGEISGNQATSNSYGHGGGVYSTGIFTMNAGTISGNTATKNGGGVYNGGTFTVTGGTISENTGGYNGSGGVYSTVAINMTDTTISGNVNGGVVVYASGKNAGESYTLSNLTVTGNTGSKSALSVESAAAWNIQGCQITDNEITGNGSTASVVYVKISSASSGETANVLNGCQIAGNTTSGYAALYVSCGSGRTLQVTDCTITGNTGTSYAGGIYCDSGNSQVTIGEGTRIEDNTGKEAGGVSVHLASDGTGCVTVDGAVVTGNTGGTTGGVYTTGNQFEFKSGAIYGNTGSDFCATGYKKTYSLIAASQMSAPDSDIDFSGLQYSWAGAPNGTEDQPQSHEGQGGDVTLTAQSNLVRYFAKIGDTEYRTLEEALDAVETGGTIEIIYGQDGFGSKYEIDKPFRITKSVTIKFDGQQILADGNELFTIDGQSGDEQSATKARLMRAAASSSGIILTLQGTAMMDGKINVKDGNSLVMAGSITPYYYSNGSPISKHLIVNVENGDFTINGTVPYISGARCLEVNLAKDQYITAGESFNFEPGSRITVKLDEDTVNQFIEAKVGDKLPDVTLVQGNVNAEVLSQINMIDNFGSLVQKTVDDEGNIVLEKLVVEIDANALYVGGRNASDTDGNGTEEKPFATLEKALTVAKDKNIKTIYVLGELTLSDSVDGKLSDEENITLKRTYGYKGHLIKTSGDLILTNITLDGSASYFQMRDSMALILVSGSGVLTLGKGAVLQNNDVSQNKSFTTTSGLTYHGGGVYVVSGGHLVMNDGAKIRNCTAPMGGAVTSLGNFTLNGGEITQNHAVKVGTEYGSGGGVAIIGGTMTMNGGKITCNTAESNGGGIAQPIAYNFKNASHLYVYGGDIQGNIAGNTGGGIYVQVSNEATVGREAPSTSKVRITDNSASSVFGTFSGGGIYVNGGIKGYPNGLLQLYRVVVTNNTAAINGAGLGGCATSNTKIYLTNGGAFYANSVEGVEVVSDVATDNIDHGTGAPVIITPGTSCPVEFEISPIMLGNGAYNWKNVKDNSGVSLEELSGKTFINYYSDSNTEARNIAYENANVFIEKNISNDRGGGIGSNGDVIIGTAPNPEEYTNISVNKEWKTDTESPSYIDVEILRNIEGGEPEVYGTLRVTQKDGWKKSFDKLPAKDNNGNPYTYSVREIPIDGFTPSVTPNDNGNNSFTITNTKNVEFEIPVKKNVEVKGDNADGESININKIFSFTLAGNDSSEGYELPKKTKLEITGANSGKFEAIEFTKEGTYTFTVKEQDANEADKEAGWTYDSNEWTVRVKIDSGEEGLFVCSVEYQKADKTVEYKEVTFTNTYEPKKPPKPVPSTTSLIVEKHWEGDSETIRPAGIKVQLLQNGKPYTTFEGYEATLTKENGWTHTWSNLPDKDSDDKNYTYSISEVDVPDGYTPSYKNEDGKIIITNTFKQEEPKTGTLIITKMVNGGGSAAMNKDYTFIVKDKDGKEVAREKASFGKPAVITGLAPGTYTVTEDLSSTAISGYRWNVTVSGDVITVNGASASVTVNAGENAKAAAVTFTNTYRRPPSDSDDPTPPTPTTPENPPTTPEEPPTDVPDPDVPLVNIPEEPPVTDIPEEEPPLANIPEEEPPLVDIPEEEPPLSEIPEEEPPLAEMPPVEILDGDVPKTGDTNSALLWLVMSLMALFGMGTVLTESCVRRRRK